MAIYFDSVNGSDSNDGLTLATAKKTLDASFVVSDAEIYLARGSYWRGSLGVSGRVDNLSISSVGDVTLDRPVIDGADLIEAWIDDGTGTYSASVEFETGGVGRIHAYEDAELLIRSETLSECQSTAGTFYIGGFGDTDQASPATVYIHPSDGIAPSVSGKKFEVITRYKGIFIRADSVGCDISDIHLQRFSHNNGALSVAKSATLNNVRSDFGGKHNAYLVDATINGLELIDADAPTGDAGSGQNAMFVPFATTHSTARKTKATDLKTWYRKHQIENIAPDSMYGVISHTTDTSWVYGDLEFKGGVFQWQEYAFTGYIDELIVNDSAAFIDVAGLFAFVNCSSATLEKFQWRVLEPTQFGLDSAAFSGSMVSLPDDLVMRDGGVYAYSPANMTTLFRVKGQDLAIERMAFVSEGPASTAGRRFFQDTGADGSGSFSANHNVFYGRQSSAYHLELHSGQSLSVDFNIYFTGISSQQVRLKYNGTAHTTLSAWQSASEQDSNSVYVAWADRDTFWLGDPALGDFRINPDAVVYGADGTAYTGTFADGITPLTDAEPQVGLTAWNELQVADYAPTFIGDSDSSDNATIFDSVIGLSESVMWGGRTSSAWHEQPDGTLVECLPGELRIAGARRVENLLPTADFEEGSNVKAGDAAVPVITQGAVGPAYEMQAWNLQLDISATAVGSKEYAAVYLSPFPLENVPSDGAWRSAWMRSADGNEYIVCFNISVGVSRVTIPADGVWRRYAWFQGSQFTANPHKFILGLREGYGTTPTANIDVAGVSMCAELAEYVAPEMRAFGAAGVKYFDTESENTVDVNGVVTEAVGARLPEPINALLEPAGVNVASIPSAAYSSNPADWSTYFASRATLNSDFISSGFGDWPKLIADNIEDSKQHRLNWYGAGNPLNAGDEISISMWVKSGEYTHLGLHAWGTMSRGSTHTIEIDTQQTTNDSDWSVTYGAVDPYGFTKVTFRNTVVTANNLQFALYGLPAEMANTGSPYWAGDGASGLWIAGVDVRINEEPTSFTAGAREADSALTIPSVSPSDNPQITFVNDAGQAVTNDAFSSPLCSYDGSSVLTVGGDVEAIRRISGLALADPVSGLDLKTFIQFSGFADGVTPDLCDENLVSYYSEENSNNFAPVINAGELYWGDGGSDALMTYEVDDPSYNHVAQIVAGSGGAADVNRLKVAVCVPSGSTGSAILYHARVASSNSFRLHRSVFAGKATEVASSGTGLSVVAGDTLTLSVEGDANEVIIRGYHNDVEVFSYTDSSPLPAGYPAFGSYLAGDKRVASFSTNLTSAILTAVNAVSMQPSIAVVTAMQTQKPVVSSLSMRAYLGTEITGQAHEPSCIAPVMRLTLKAYALKQLQQVLSAGVQMRSSVESVAAAQYAAAIEFTATQAGALDLSCISDEQSAVQWEWNSQFYSNPFTETVAIGDVVTLRPGKAQKVREIDVSNQAISYGVDGFAVFTGANSLNLENSGAFGGAGAFSSCGALVTLKALGTNIDGQANGFYVLGNLQTLELPSGVALALSALSGLLKLDVLRLSGLGITGSLAALNNLLPSIVEITNTGVTGAWLVNSDFDGDVDLSNNAGISRNSAEVTLLRLAAAAVANKTLDLSETSEVLPPSAYGALIGRGNTVLVDWLPQAAQAAPSSMGPVTSPSRLAQSHKPVTASTSMGSVIGSSSAVKHHSVVVAKPVMLAQVKAVAARQQHKARAETSSLTPAVSKYSLNQVRQLQTRSVALTGYGGLSYRINQSRLAQTALPAMQAKVGTYRVMRSRFPYFLGIGLDSEKEVLLAHKSVMSRNGTLRKIGKSNKRHVRFHVSIPHMTREESRYLEHWLKEYQDMRFAFSWKDNAAEEPQGLYDWTVELEDDSFKIQERHPDWFYTNFKLYGEEHFFGENDDKSIN